MKRPDELAVIALKRDLPEFGLRKGHVGTVVLVYEPDGLEVEFFDRDGETHALLTLLDEDIRIATEKDLKNPDRPQPWPLGVEPPIADATLKTRP
jgi:uncharacterized protein DUF4926